MDSENTPRKSTRSSKENICSVCHIHFSITNRPVICSKCFQKACRLHIYTEKTQTICTICIRVDLRRALTQKSQSHINSLKNELKSLQHREKANEKEISLKSALISTLESTLSAKNADFSVKTAEIESQILQEINSTKTSNEKISEIKAEAELHKTSTKAQHESWLTVTTDLMKIQNSLSTVQSDHDTLFTKYKKLSNDNSKMLTFQKVRTLTCNKCYQVIVLKYKEDILKILSCKEKKSRLIPSILQLNLMTLDDVHSRPCKCTVT